MNWRGEGGGCQHHRWLVAFRENRARKVRDKSSYVSSGIRLRLCVGRCQIQIALRWRHFDENKKKCSNPRFQIANFFPKSKFLHSSPPTNFQPIISRSPFILRSFHPFPRVSSHAREVLTWQNVIFEELRSTLRTFEAPAQLVNQVGVGERKFLVREKIRDLSPPLS